MSRRIFTYVYGVFMCMCVWGGGCCGGGGALYVCVPSRVDMDKICDVMEPVCNDDEQEDTDECVRVFICMWRGEGGLSVYDLEWTETGLATSCSPSLTMTRRRIFRYV